MTRTCCIFAGSPEKGLPCLPVPQDALMLCADSGLRLANLLKIKPDLVMGDFDSLGFVPNDVEIVQAPVEKDDTDTMLAVRRALSLGYDNIRIYGAFGGRLDHTIANLQTLRFLHEHGAEGMLIGANDYACIVSGKMRKFPKMRDFSLSVFALTDICEGVTLRGVHYPLENAVLRASFPIGVSNEIIEDAAEIECGKGMLLVVVSALHL